MPEPPGNSLGSATDTADKEAERPHCCTAPGESVSWRQRPHEPPPHLSDIRTFDICEGNKAMQVLAIDVGVQSIVFALERHGKSLQTIVKRLGDAVEIRRSCDDLPPRVEP